MDSDGDGDSNGKELGDPGCTWIKGGPPPTGKATGHPGIVILPYYLSCSMVYLSLVQEHDDMVENRNVAVGLQIV